MNPLVEGGTRQGFHDPVNYNDTQPRIADELGARRGGQWRLQSPRTRRTWQKQGQLGCLYHTNRRRLSITLWERLYARMQFLY